MPNTRRGAIVGGGERCRARPMHGSPFCFWQNPETQTEAAEARKLGGRRRHREGTPFKTAGKQQGNCRSRQRSLGLQALPRTFASRGNGW